MDEGGAGQGGYSTYKSIITITILCSLHSYVLAHILIQMMISWVHIACATWVQSDQKCEILV